jgi:hypothetical protein
MNHYGFAGGDRINFGDPFGLTPDCAVVCPVLAGAGVTLGGPLSWFAVAVAATLSADMAWDGRPSGAVSPGARTDATSVRRPSPGEIADAVGATGARVFPGKTKTGEGVLIKWPDGDNTHIRVENHPLKGSGGKPVEHGNVETRGPDGNLKGEKSHVKKPGG